MSERERDNANLCIKDINLVSRKTSKLCAHKLIADSPLASPQGVK